MGDSFQSLLHSSSLASLWRREAADSSSCTERRTLVSGAKEFTKSTENSKDSLEAPSSSCAELRRVGLLGREDLSSEKSEAEL